MPNLTTRFAIHKNPHDVFYTLRKSTINDCGVAVDDFKFATLTGAEQTSITMALEIVQSYKAVLGGDAYLCDTLNQVSFIDRDPPTDYESEKIKMIESNITPFGSMQGQPISSLPTDYLLWVCDQSIKKQSNLIMKHFASLTMAEIIARKESDAITKLKNILASGCETLNTQKNPSEYKDEMGNRKEYEVKIMVAKKPVLNKFERPNYFFKLMSGTDAIIYSGSKNLGKIGDQLKIRATVKKHDIHFGVKTTHISRPVIV